MKVSLMWGKKKKIELSKTFKNVSLEEVVQCITHFLLYVEQHALFNMQSQTDKPVESSRYCCL